MTAFDTLRFERVPHMPGRIATVEYSNGYHVHVMYGHNRTDPDRDPRRPYELSIYRRMRFCGGLGHADPPKDSGLASVNPNMTREEVEIALMVIASFPGTNPNRLLDAVVRF